MTDAIPDRPPITDAGFILPLRGPMQSYADRGFGLIREAGAFPSRSAVLGILAAALGIERLGDELVRLHDALYVHVATVQPGAVRTDFHSTEPRERVARSGKPPNKTITYRDYHYDAHFLAFVAPRTDGDAAALREAAEALGDPVYVGYLGRRSCPPSVPLCPQPVPADATNPVAVLYRASMATRPAPGQRPYGRLATDDPLDVYLDGRWRDDEIAAVMPEGVTLGAVSRGERRDRLAGARRAYHARAYTHFRLIPEPSDDLHAFIYDAAP